MLRIFLCFFLLLGVLAVPAGAAIPLPGTSGAEDAAQDGDAAIANDTDSGEDARIERRIGAIYDAIPDLEPVVVAVDAGVVVLSGEVDTPGAIDRAEQIARRVDGVVAVENTITRDLAFGTTLGLSGWREDVAGIVRMLPLVAVAILIVAGFAALGYLLASFGPLWRRVTPNNFLAGLVQSAVRFVFVVIGLIVALNLLGAGTLLGAVLGGAGVIGIALGFAMRDTIENYVASLMLSVRQPFRANDHVVIEDREGRVIRLTSRATVLMTLDGNHLRIPNSTVFRAVILNYTRNPQRRMDFVLGVDADDDARAARRLGIEVLKGLPFVLPDPPPEARIEEVGDSNVAIRYLAWIDQTHTDFFKAKSRAIPAVKTALEEAGFGLPEPIYRLRFDPRSEALPFKNIEGGEARAVPAPQSPKPPRPAPEPDDHDVAPDDEIARMVERDRAEGGAEADLLDHGRPVE